MTLEKSTTGNGETAMMTYSIMCMLEKPYISCSFSLINFVMKFQLLIPSAVVDDGDLYDE